MTDPVTNPDRSRHVGLLHVICRPVSKVSREENNQTLSFFSEMVASNALSRGVFVVAAKRTPFGTFGGSLKGHSPTDLSVSPSTMATISQ